MATHVLVNIALLMAATTAAADGAGGDATRIDRGKLKMIVAAIADARSRVRSLRIVVDRRTTSPVPDGGVLGGKEIFAFKDDLRSMDRTFKIKKMVERTQTVKIVEGKPQVVHEQTVLDEGTERLVAVFDGDRLLMHHGHNVAQIESLATREAAPGSRFDCYYLREIGWYVRDPMAPEGLERNHKACALPEAFLRGRYRISADSVAGVSAMKLEGDIHTAPENGLPGFEGSEKIWLDDARGFMLLRRQVFDRAGAPVVDITTVDPVELVEGCWIPKLCTIHSSQYGVTELRLAEWQVNDRSDSEFQIEVPPNAMVTDRAETAARGLPLKNSLIRYSSGAGELIDEPLKAVFAERRRKRWLYIFLGTLLVGLVAFAWQLRRRRV